MRSKRRRARLLTAAGTLALTAAAVTYLVHAGAAAPARTVTPAAAHAHVSGPPTPALPAASAAAPSPGAIAPATRPSAARPPRPAHAASPVPAGDRSPRPRPGGGSLSSASSGRGPGAPPPSRPRERQASTDFAITTFNMLGASHTAAGGTHPTYASGPERARRAAVLLRRHDSSVVGFQELQRSQLATLRRHTDLRFFPGSALGPRDSENSIGWRADRWLAVAKHTVTIPYFDGSARVMPVVLLRERRTGLEAWFANFHNPADTRRFHHQERYRLRATDIETRLADRLVDRSGVPVFITGDMNERGAYFCRLTAHAPMVAARGGTNNGRCRPDRPRTIDWIFGSQGVVFTGYTEDRSRLVRVTTDHPVVTARARIIGDPAHGSGRDRSGPAT